MALSKATQAAREHKFAALIATGMSQAAAYRRVWPKSKGKPETIRNKASELASRESVRAMVTEALKQAKVLDLDSVGQAYQDLLGDIESARNAKNYTALANLTRQRLQVLGMLKDGVNVNLFDASTDEELVKRLAKGDQEIEAIVKRLLTPDGFDKPKATNEAGHA